MRSSASNPVHFEGILCAYAMMVVLAGMANGFSLKSSHVPQNLSITQSRLQDLHNDYKPKLLQNQKSLMTNLNNQRKNGLVLVNGRAEVVTHQESHGGLELHQAFSKRGNLRTGAQVESVFKARYSTFPLSVYAHMKLHQKDRNSTNVRHKRYIFPPDNRRRINNYQASYKFPYSASVKISTGCTGTLISNQHVLTAAHCIHNKTHFITQTSNVQVGFLKSNGKFHWYRVTSVQFPRNEWMNSKGSHYDYAVLKLSKPHTRKFFRLAVPKQSSLHIYFSSFPGDKKSNTLWYIDCSASVLTLSSNIISKCDASKGSSGSGVYTVIRRRGKNKRVIIGVLSGETELLRLPSGRYRYFNNAVSLKAADIRNICRWAEYPRGCPS